MTAFARQKFANARIARLKSIIRHVGFLDPIDINRDDVANDGRLKYVSILQAIVGPTLISQVGKLSERAVPSNNLQVR